MKKRLIRLLTTISIAGLCGGNVLAVEPSSLNDVKTAEDQLNYFETTPAAGNREKGYNLEEFKETQMCKDMLSALSNYFIYTDADQDNEAITNYWASKGVTKIYHDLDDPERQWAVYMPNGLYFEADEDYEYPVVFCLHGGNNTILMTESYGWSELAGKEGFITVIPWAQAYSGGDIDANLIVEEIPRIMEVLREEYNIDETRIYASGFSAGGRSCINALMAYPDLFAAGAIQPTSLFPSGEEAVYANDSGYKTVFSYEDFERITEYTMPLIIYGGTFESCWPISLDYDLARQVTSEDLTRYLNITGANFPEITDETRTSIATLSGSSVSRLTGFDFTLEQSEIVQKQGTNCFIGSYYNDDGVCAFQALAVEGMVHWPLYCEAEIEWEFMSQFARDTETGELLYVEE